MATADAATTEDAFEESVKDRLANLRNEMLLRNFVLTMWVELR